MTNTTLVEKGSTNDKGQRTNDSPSQLALIAPSYLQVFVVLQRNDEKY
ncbi:hypothetical protein LC605_19865 [Nostoc sp. CHAB 5836]|nr:hypothetical protein [Nostoc sp. CHAB 5836]MCC5617300.1 hypothetical protein [Nostoc sp. CHAB 5836]